MKLLEIGTDEDYVHYLVQSIAAHMVPTISLTPREIVRLCLEAKSSLLRSEFGTGRYFEKYCG